MAGKRDPYPLEKYENDSTLSGSKKGAKQPYTVPAHLAQSQDPWYRLSAKHTLSSNRREHGNYDPLAPADDLDFVLKSLYDQEGLFQHKNEVMKQPETFKDDHGRVLKNRIQVIKAAPPALNHPLRVTEQKDKRSIHCISNSIEGSHIQLTNKGYSRKPDGGFFTS